MYVVLQTGVNLPSTLHFSLLRATCPFHLVFSDLITTVFVKSTNNEASHRVVFSSPMTSSSLNQFTVLNTFSPNIFVCVFLVMRVTKCDKHTKCLLYIVTSRLHCDFFL